MAEWVGEDSVILRLGSLDTDPGSKPIAHIWRSHSKPWLAYGNDLPEFDEAPPSKK